MSEERISIEILFDKFKDYLHTSLAIIKLSTAEKTASVIAVLVAMLMATLGLFLFITILLIGTALLIGAYLQNIWLGFFITAAGVLLLGLIAWRTRDRWLRVPITNLLLAIFFKEKKDETH